ncbi:hypothetical protein ACTI_17770 [Actinoplanes sp. OR16]|uniref:DUF4291 domain-containing protein n=1 Tax=Actinoplanes sp. OR16 TaxID=946334 RepID=UPI000F6ED41C|nr:DUF4291 domain-containing protein [Actinoplanes sp. OR16]BBH65092.1 hypothetical protein ACTI_17770 [Actinoplanes sp. OR16]
MRQVRARFDDHTITVYQAYSPAIAGPALRAGRFVPPFKPDRMTWIKPSFLWMMYRSGWATKPGQERVLSISITRAGFSWALEQAALSSYDHRVHDSRATWQAALKAAPTRVQWDPERDLRLRELPDRSLQLGLGPQAVPHYTNDWITEIRDATPLAHQIRALLTTGDDAKAATLLPQETPYPLPPELMTRIAASPPARPRPA